MTFRTRSFITALATAAVTLTVAVDAGVVERAAQRRRAHRARARQRGAARRRNAVAPPAGDAGGARRRGGRARPARLGARDLHRPRRHASSAIRAVGRGAAHARESQRSARSPAGAARRARRRPALQRDARHRHALRRGAGAQPDGADAQRGAAGAAAHRDPRPARGAAPHGARRRRRRAGRGAAPGVGRVAAPEPAGAAIADVAEPLCRRRLLPARARLRHRRDRHGGARARRVGSRDRPARRRARDRSGAHGSHPRRHGRRGRWWSTTRARCSWPTPPRGGCCGCRTSREGRHYLEIVRDPDIAAQVSAALRGGEDGQSLELPLQHGVDRHASAARRCAPSARPARWSCCTTSPTCAAPIASGATSSPTSRTSCGRR